MQRTSLQVRFKGGPALNQLLVDTVKLVGELRKIMIFPIPLYNTGFKEGSRCVGIELEHLQLTTVCVVSKIKAPVYRGIVLLPAALDVRNHEGWDVKMRVLPVFDDVFHGIQASLP